MDTLDPEGGDSKKKMSTQEALQRVRVVQALAVDIETEKKAREIRWQNFAKGLRNVIPANVLPNVSTLEQEC
ncbi:hypothetical protein PILCRDRAFT_10261 [Piloderma croceum F 1598]|uniref:Uncharacterized protein n=1 Tax=Piloderma croceum (strain F 1598) TaxID=765440 RepID=A0A0C3F3T5_PILCF|nr:hypothetical protein PILCRDRAFT_10261 [Piloderma croceum F 1598]